jgi:molybdopterin synthase catalytic subunit
MLIQVLYFAVFRERIGKDAETVELPAGSRIADAIEALEKRHEAVRSLRGRYRIALNQSMIEDITDVLADGDELVLIPPVAGGAAARRRPDERHVVISAEPLSIDRCVAAVSGPDAGGIATFTGHVRRHSRGITVDHLVYEAYGEMAVKVMREIVDEIEREIPNTRLAVEHRTGRLEIGDVAVVIAAASAHRAEAFTACRAMIDRLKQRVPIWKKEVGTDGAEWVGLGP